MSSDFVDDFITNPTTGALATVTNEASINQSIRNLVLTSPGERPGRAAVGSKVLSSLFDPGTPFSMSVLQASIQNVIQNYERRVENVTVTIDDSGIQNNSVSITVTYQPINLPQTVTYSFDLQRVR
jgi:phage baseplate assembly protein W